MRETSIANVDLEALGRFTRERRKTLGLTQTQLGERIGWAQERVSVFENGRYGTPSLPQLRLLAEALELPLAQVLGTAGFDVAPGVQGSDAYIDPRSDEVHRRVVMMFDQIHTIESQIHGAEARLEQAEAIRASLREQRGRMAELLSACAPEGPNRSYFP